MSNRTIFIGTDLYYSDEFVDNMCTNYNREIRELNKRIKELEAEITELNDNITCWKLKFYSERSKVYGIYGMRGAGKTYYETIKNKAKNNKRTRSDRWNS